MPAYSIIYSTDDGEDFYVETRYFIEEWKDLPKHNVQVILVWLWDGRKWTGMPWDRTVYTGHDSYDPFNTKKKKFGKLVSDELYNRCWEHAKRMEKP
jgi:hypothetical protein